MGLELEEDLLLALHAYESEEWSVEINLASNHHPLRARVAELALVYQAHVVSGVSLVVLEVLPVDIGAVLCIDDHDIGLNGPVHKIVLGVGLSTHNYVLAISTGLHIAHEVVARAPIEHWVLVPDLASSLQTAPLKLPSALLSTC